jgi:hypothetical protein
MIEIVDVLEALAARHRSEMAMAVEQGPYGRAVQHPGVLCKNLGFKTNLFQL